MHLYIQIYLINVSIYIYINYFIQYIPFLQIPVLFLQEYSNSCGIQSHSGGFLTFLQECEGHREVLSWDIWAYRQMSADHTYIAWYFSHVQILFSHVIGKTAKRLIRKRAECKCEQSSKEDDKGKVLESELAQGAQWCLWCGEAGGESWWWLGPVIWLRTVWGPVLRVVLAWWGSDCDCSWLQGAGDEWQSR